MKIFLILQAKYTAMIKKFIEQHRYKLLLLSTLIYLIVPAYIMDSVFFELLIILAMSFLFVQSLIVVFDKKGHMIIAFIIGALILSVTWVDYMQPHIAIQTIKLSMYVFFFGFIMTGLFKMIFTSKKVTLDMITVAIVIYLMIGIIGGALAHLIHLHNPSAYTYHEALHGHILLNFTYYSYVTLTTLGYGDITPNMPQSQSLAYLLAIIGQFYIAVTVALLVSKYASQGSDIVTPGEE